MVQCCRKYLRWILSCWTVVILYFCLLTLNRRSPASRQSSSLFSPEKTDTRSSYTFHPDAVTTSTMMSHSRCLVPAFTQKVHTYLRALQHAVAIVSLPASLTDVYRDKCTTLTAQHIRKTIETHPHSLELHFPSILQDMSRSSSFATVNGSTSSRSSRLLEGDFNPLWHPSVLSSSPSLGAMVEPLFYYVAALPYHVVYCTNKRRHKEDWTGRDKYWLQVADYLLLEDAINVDTTEALRAGNHPANTIVAQMNTPSSASSTTSAFRRNMGADFVVPASHPQLSPGKMHPSSLSYLLRASFLKTDLDVAGSVPKDVVVPYFLPVDDSSAISDQESSNRSYQPDKSEAAAADAAALSQSCRNRHSGILVSNTTSTIVPHHRRRLLFFAGSDNPRNGFRTLFCRQLQRALTLESKSVKEVETTTMSTGKVSVRGKGDGDDSDLTEAIDRGGVYFQLTPLPQPQTAAASFFSLFSMAGTTMATPHENTEGEEDITSSQQPPPGSLSSEDEGRWFGRQMRESLFCLVLRGDTTSSLRLFHAVDNGCVPVIVSDGLASHLPFGESMLDYSKFALFFPESIATTPQGMQHLLHTLRSMSTKTTTNEMQCALLEARRYLLYNIHHTASSTSPKSLLNPVTLTLMDLLMRRETYCRSVLAKNDHGSMCRNLLARLQIANVT